MPALVEPSAPPREATERALAEVLAEVTGVEHVSAELNFFSDLNADSLTMAKFCARVRKRSDLPSVAMKDVYRNPTLAQLAAALVDDVPEAGETAVAVPTEMPTPASTRQYVVCGVLQLLVFLLYAYASALVVAQAYGWMAAASGLLDLYLRAVAVGAVLGVGVCGLPVVAKWVLVGRWRPQRIPVWSLAYFRFWLVKTLVRANPLVLFVGSPLYVGYLRLLGARIGRNVAIFAPEVPVCADLLTVGEGAVIRKDSHFSCYRAHAGMIEIGPVTIGRDALVSESTVLDIDTVLGDGAQLGHASSLHPGQTVPAGERWCGSPAAPGTTDFRTVGPANCGTLRRVAYVVGQVLLALLVYLPLADTVLVALVGHFPRLVALVPGTNPLVEVLAASLVVLAGFVVAGALAALVVPRLLALVVRPDRTYPLYGLHYSLHRTIMRLTNRRFYTELFGNSSYIVDYLKVLGYDVSRAEQTGSNFGTEIRHETPYHVTVGRGTMVADGLSVNNVDYSATSFRVRRATIGAHNFLGNHVAYPAGGRTGENCLLATKVMVPVDGPVREGVGLLGSPAFEIPRSVERDSSFDELRDGEALRRSLAAKNRYNRQTMAIFLLTRWVHFLGLTALLVLTDFYHRFGVWTVGAEVVLALTFSVGYFVLLERAAAGFRPLQPRFCSIYDPYFWWHERFWKFALPTRLVAVFAGTPYKNLVSRLLGVQLGRRVFDDNCAMPERTLVAVGDDCTLAAGSILQSHSQEDGAFKSDHVRVGAGCTVGPGSLVHYGATVGDGAVVAADSFVMKGTEVAARTRWGGNPARELRGLGLGPAPSRRALGTGSSTTVPTPAAAGAAAATTTAVPAPLGRA